MKENITHTQHTGARNNSTTHLPLLQKISQYYEQHINNIPLHCRIETEPIDPNLNNLHKHKQTSQRQHQKIFTTKIIYTTKYAHIPKQ